MFVFFQDVDDGSELGWVDLREGSSVPEVRDELWLDDKQYAIWKREWIFERLLIGSDSEYRQPRVTLFCALMTSDIWAGAL